MSDQGLQGFLVFFGGIWLIGLIFMGRVWIRRFIKIKFPTRRKKIRNKKNVREGRASFNRRRHRWWDQDAGGMNLGNMGKFYNFYGLSTSFISH